MQPLFPGQTRTGTLMLLFMCKPHNVGMPQSWFHTESGQSLGCLLPEDDLFLQLGRPPRPLVDVLPPEYDANAWLPELVPLYVP